MMSNTFYAFAAFAVALLVVTKPIGLWLTPLAEGRAPRVVEKADHAILNIFARGAQEQSWQGYAASLLAFNAIGLFFLYILQRVQGYLPLNPQGFGGVAPDQALNLKIV